MGREKNLCAEYYNTACSISVDGAEKIATICERGTAGFNV